jgi:UDP-N-acetylmuramate--alanine ligase
MAENKIDTYYFLGIGGIGMSALARYFASEGCRVLGYDRVCTPLTTELEAEGIAVQYDDRLDWVEGLDVEKTLVVRTPAVPEDAAVYVWLREHGFHIVKRAELLGKVTRQKKALCVAGTHGKTTTSTILAHILYGSHAGANAFLGGIANNYGTNLLLNKESDVVVVEADEFDRSFHHLTPYMSVITSMDPDHLDIYGTEAAYRASFEQYAGLVEHALVVKSSLKLNVETLKARVYTYSVGEKADFYADNVRVKDGEIWFDFYTPESKVADIQLGVPVLVNVENSVAAMALAVLMGATEEELREGMRSFMGVYRRFNVHVNTPRVTYIDDYAHHPQELKATIDSVRYLFPERYVIGVFQPHLYSRTRDFADGFAEVLSGVDEVALLPIYPAREEPIEGVTSEWLMEKIGTKRALVLPNILAKYLRERVKQCMAQGKDCVVVTMGAGDISDQVNDIEKALQI